METKDLVLQISKHNSLKHHVFSVHDSPVLIKNEDQSDLLALVEWTGTDWVLRQLDANFALSGKAEFEVPIAKKVEATFQQTRWQLFVKDRSTELPDCIVEEENGEKFRQLVLYTKKRVLCSELLPVEYQRAQHPQLRNLDLPALLDKNWVTVEVGPNLYLKSRLVQLAPPVTEENNMRGPLFTSLGFFLLLALNILLMSSHSGDSTDLTEKKLAPSVISADRIAKLRDAMAQADTLPAPAAAAAPQEKQTKTEGKVQVKVKAPSALSKLLGQISSAKIAAYGSAGKSTGATSGSGSVVDGIKTGGDKGLQGVSLKGVGQGHQLDASGIGKASVSWLDEEAIVDGGLDRDVIAQIIRSHLGEIRYCYERQLSADPSLQGKVQVRFTIGAQGAVTDKRVNQTTLNNGFVEGCILQRVAQWNFPKPKGGVQVAVTYPFLFRLSSE